jgi:hypothetical protein
MRILRVRLQADEATWQALRRFYEERLGLPSVTTAPDRYGFTTGRTLIEFTPAERGQPFYHFALRVPRNRFEAARAWLGSHAELLTEPNSSETRFEFANWRAEACYAHDPCGNIVELIAHHELPEETLAGGPFSASELLGVCELGLAGPDTRAMARALEPLGIGLWDGTLDLPGRLAFMGGREGTLILAQTGRGWLPTGRRAEPHAAHVVVAGAGEAEATLPGTAHQVRTTARQPSPPPGG